METEGTTTTVTRCQSVVSPQRLLPSHFEVLSDVPQGSVLGSLLLINLTAWSTVLPDKLTDPQLLKKFAAFYGTRRLITAFTRACHLYLS